jgi:hypothetical protein
LSSNLLTSISSEREITLLRAQNENLTKSLGLYEQDNQQLRGLIESKDLRI